MAARDGVVAAPGHRERRRALGELLDRARGGHGSVVLVEGEPGIGKSVLLRECVDEAAGRGFALAAGAADQVGQAIPFYALRRALGEPFALFAAECPDEDRQAVPAWWIGRVRAHLIERAAATAVLVCLDDLQWADAGTLAALRTLPQELAHHPVAWMLARSTSGPPEAERLFDALAGDGAARLGLAPLTDEGVAALLTDAFGAPPHPGLSALAAGASGNPRLLAELAGGLREQDAVRVTDGTAKLVSARLPGRVHRAARRRLDEVGGQARHVLTTAAVLGGSFRLDDLAEMLGATPAGLLPAIEEAMAAGLIAAGENEFSFRHPLLRRALGDLVPRPGRSALHRQYGQILLRRDESAVLAADHLLRSAEPGDTAALADLDAAAQRTLHGAPRAAADLAARALELTAPGNRDALPRTVAAARALAAAGRLDQADRIARDALARPLPPDAEARLRCVLSSVLFLRGAAADAAAEAGAVLAGAALPGDLRDDATTARLLALASARDAAAVPLARAVLRRSGRYGRPVVVAALVALAAASWDAGRAGEALDLLRDAAREETPADRDARHVPPLLALAAALVDLRRLDDAEIILAADDRAAGGLVAGDRAAGDRTPHATPARAAASIVRARIQLAGGRLADAEAAARDALATAESTGALGYASAARCVLAVIALQAGDVVSAVRHLADGVVPGPQAGQWYARSAADLAQAQVSEACDGAAGVLARLSDAQAELETRPGLLLGDPAAAAWLTRTALVAGNAELAAGVARAAAALAGANPGYAAIAAAAAHSLGLVGRDPARLAEAATTHPDRWARACAAEDLGLLHAGRREHDLAVRHLTEAVQGYLDVGAAADTARTRRALRRLGVRHRDWTRPVPRPETGWESLTKAERSAAALVAQGLNNREVAARMYISEHTVAFYLRQAFRKLAIRSRVQLTRIVIERRTAPGDAAAAGGPAG